MCLGGGQAGQACPEIIWSAQLIAGYRTIFFFEPPWPSIDLGTQYRIPSTATAMLLYFYCDGMKLLTQTASRYRNNAPFVELTVQFS